jgi:5-(carboxyamino)imidazole ribonucleotide mutase
LAYHFGIKVKTMTDDRPTPPSGSVLKPRVGIIMGSRNDWATMQFAKEHLDDFGVLSEVRVVSAHRTPDFLFDYAEQAESRGIEVLIAGAGGAAHLPGMCAAKTTLPVLGVPIESALLRGVDSLLSIVQMPAGIPVGTLAIGKAGAINAALFAISILAIKDPVLRDKLKQFRIQQTEDVLKNNDPRVG